MNTSIKSTRLKVVFLLYCLITVCFTLYYSENFTDFTKFKGDEYFYYFGFITGISYLFIILTHVIVAKINLANLLFMPLVILLLGIVVGMAFFLSTTLDGTPRQTFYVHSSIHILLSYLFGRLLWRKHLKGATNKLRTTQASQNGS
jgi:hypothetical protein